MELNPNHIRFVGLPDIAREEPEVHFILTYEQLLNTRFKKGHLYLVKSILIGDALLRAECGAYITIPIFIDDSLKKLTFEFYTKNWLKFPKSALTVCSDAEYEGVKSPPEAGFGK